MPWLIDGSNVLGALRLDRHSDQAKRELVRRLASFARAKRTRVTCVFDGPEPPSFATRLGPVAVAFSGSQSADDLIAARAAHAKGWRVVTQDRGLEARIRRRGVEIVSPLVFVRELEAEAEAGAGESEDWERWFSDPGNRSKF